MAAQQAGNKKKHVWFVQYVNGKEITVATPTTRRQARRATAPTK